MEYLSLADFLAGLKTTGVEFDTQNPEVISEAQLIWDETNGTISLGLKGSESLQIGQEIVYYVINNTASQIDKGSVVYATSAQNNRFLIEPYLANGSIGSEKVLGITTENIAAGESGYVTQFGGVKNFDTSSFSVGDVLYASATTPGGLTDSAPLSPNLKVIVGFVTTADSAVNGGAVHVQSSFSPVAANITYDNSISNLIASNVQAAIDELNAEKAGIDALSANILLYPTTSPADISPFKALVTELDDPRYDTTAVNVSTGVISTPDQVVGELLSDAEIFTGNPGVINVSTIGNIRRVSGTNTASFYFKIFKRADDGTEIQLAESDPTQEVTSSSYRQFAEAALLNNGTFIETDRILIRFYATPSGVGSNPTYEFEFGGNDPIRTLLPVPANIVATKDAVGIFTDTSNFNNQLSASDDTVQKALDTLDDHTHTTDEVSEGSNLYYTDTRVNTRIDARVDKNFVEALNINIDGGTY